MSSRIIRGEDRLTKLNVQPSAEGHDPFTPQASEQQRTSQKAAFDQGYAEGKRAGKEQAEAALEPTFKRYEQSIVEMCAAHSAVVDSLGPTVVELAIEVARKVVQRELALDPDLVSALVTAALRRTQTHDGVKLRVNPEDYSRIKQSVEDNNKVLTILQDASLERGEFIIDTSQTHIDGRVIRQIESLGRLMIDG